ncbi:MAG: alginate lyase family protein [Planctomycetota bacterium]
MTLAPPTKLYPGIETLRRAAAADAEAVGRLRGLAERLGEIEPPAVTSRRAAPVGFTPGRHDYVSMQTYWWPNPDTPDGLPYVHRDGRIGPDVIRFDRPRLDLHADGVRTLTLAALLADGASAAASAETAARWLRAWFLDPATRMAPHLRHAQFLPGQNTGTFVGGIDLTIRLPAYLETIDLLLNGFPGVLTGEERAGLTRWWSDMLDWLWSDPVRRWHDRAENNLGVYYDRAVAFLARRLGREAVAADRAEGLMPRRVRRQIEPDGRLPHELRRTRSFGYCLMNVLGFCELCRVLDPEGDTLFGRSDADGRSVARAVDWLWGVASGPGAWPYEEVQGVQWDRLAVVWGTLPEALRRRYPLERVSHRLSPAVRENPWGVYLRPALHPFRPAAWDEFPELLPA